MAIEAILAALVVLLLVLATFMAIEGLMAAAGAVALGRCSACDHLISRNAAGTCPYCSHQRLAHLAHLPASFQGRRP